jgi:membrane protein involved in colicin uptake
MTQTQVAYWNYRENMRHSKADEAEQLRSHTANERETARHYLATETEDKRTHLVNEDLKRQQNAETRRSDLAREAIDVARNAETTRSNIANEAIRRDQNAETATHNRAAEAAEVARNTETARHDVTTETETQRHNKATEWKTLTDLIGSLFKGTGVPFVSKLIAGLLKNGASKADTDRLQVIINNSGADKPLDATVVERPASDKIDPIGAIIDALYNSSIPYQIVKKTLKSIGMGKD